MKNKNEKRVAAVFLIALLSVLCFTACGKKETKKEVKKEVTGQTEKEKTVSDVSDGHTYLLERFCEVMDVEKKDLGLTFNYENEGNVSYDITVKGREDLAGTYVFVQYDNWLRIARKITNQEKQERKLVEVMGYDDAHRMLYEVLYDSEEAEVKEHINKRGTARTLPIDSSRVKKYKEEKLGTGDIWECWNGYINNDNHFMVSYYGDTSSWTQGVFQNGKWITKQLPVPGGGYEYYYCSTFESDTLWYFNPYKQKLKVSNKNAQIICDIKLSKWCEKNGVGSVDDVIKLPNGKAIFNCLPDKWEGEDYRAHFVRWETEDNAKAFLVDLKTRKVVKKFDRSIHGNYSAGKIYYFNNSANLMEIINPETGETEELLDLSNVYNAGGYGVKYMAYNDVMNCIEHIDFAKCDYPVKCSINDGEVYFSYYSGVYYYNKKEQKLEQIVDGTKQELFREMQGSIAVDKDGEHIYMLGFIGGGDDEGPNDFLCMTKK